MTDTFSNTGASTGRASRPAGSRPGGSDRVPPHNLSAEESLLGALLLSRDAVNTVGELGMQADVFYRPAHQHVFDAMRNLLTIGQPIDAVTVADELRKVGLLDDRAGDTHAAQLRRQLLRTPRRRQEGDLPAARDEFARAGGPHSLSGTGDQGHRPL